MRILVADTEGLFSNDADTNHDFRIVCLSILTCSIFIYNDSSGILNNDTISKMNMFIELSRLLRQSVEDENNINQVMPKLTWVIRNFDKELNQTPDEYLN